MAQGQIPISADVATESTEIVSANGSREWVAIVNDSDTDVYIAIDQDAILNKGIRLNANGGSAVFSKSGDMFSNGAINGIHGGSGTKVVTAQEGV